MRCLARILLHLLTAISLLFFVTTIAFLLRAQWFDEHVFVVRETSDAAHIYAVWSYGGGFSVGEYKYPINDWRRGVRWLDKNFTTKSRPRVGRGWERGFGPGNTRQSFAGFTSIRSFSGPYGWQFLIVPAWCPILIFGTLPTLALVRWRRRRLIRSRSQKGLCPTCGYDLRATPERCPECGTESKQQAEPQPAEGAAA